MGRWLDGMGQVKALRAHLKKPRCWLEWRWQYAARAQPLEACSAPSAISGACSEESRLVQTGRAGSRASE